MTMGFCLLVGHVIPPARFIEILRISMVMVTIGFIVFVAVAIPMVVALIRLQKNVAELFSCREKTAEVSDANDDL